MSDSSQDHPPASRDFDGSDNLNPELYAELKRLAIVRMARQEHNITFQPTMLVHEAWLRMSAGNDHWKDRNHFLAAAAITMRHILIDNARRKMRLRHGSGKARAGSNLLDALATPEPDENILLIDEGVCELEKEHPLRAKIVVARFFGGLTNAEIAGTLGIGERSVERHWAAAKVWLYRWIQGSKKE